MKKTLIALLIFTAIAQLFSCKNSRGDSMIIPSPADRNQPTFSAVPISGSTINGLTEVTLSFSEPVRNADEVSSYNLDGPGLGSMSITSIIENDRYTYRILLDGEPGNGPLFISLADITDSAGNPLSGDTILYTIDSENPTITADPASGSRVSTLGRIDVTFSKPVLGADDADVYVLGGFGASSMAITGVTGIGGNTYRLTLSGEPVGGPISLMINDITDEVGNHLAGTGLVYVGDTTPPTCTSQPLGGDRVNALHEVFITYSEPVTGASTGSSYVVAGTGAGSLGVASVEHYMDNTYRLVLDGSIGEGAIQIQLSNIKDLLGNPLSNTTIDYTGDLTNPTQSAAPLEGTCLRNLDYVDITYSKPVLKADMINNYILSGSGASSLSVTGAVLLSGTTYRVSLAGILSNGPLTVTINDVTDLAGNPLLDNRVLYAGDVQAPAFTADPAEGSHVSALTSVVVTFSEAVLNASNKSNFPISGGGAGSLSIDSITPLTSAMYRINLSGAPVNGAVAIQIQNITDPAGNALTGSTLHYQADLDNPTFTSSPSGGSVVRQLQVLDISFSEVMSGAASASSYTLGGAGTGTLALDRAVHLSGNTYRLYFNGEPGKGEITITMSGITDESGNAPSSSAISFTADTTPPTQTSIEENGSIVPGIPQVDVIFSEPVTGAGISSNYTISGSGKGSLALSYATLLTGTTYRLVFSGTPVTAKDVTITMTGIRDTAGNHMVGNSIHYTIDSVNPTKTADPASGSYIQTLPSVTITYSETVQHADVPANYSLSGPGIGTLALTGVTHLSGNTYRLDLTGTPVDGVISITISNIIDAAGNQVNGNVITYYGDFTAPTVSSNYPSAGATSVGTDTIIQIIFSENVDPATINSANITVNDGSGNLTGTLTCLGRHIFFMPSGYYLTPNTTITVCATTGIADPIGFHLAENHQFSFTTGSSYRAKMIPDMSTGGYTFPVNLTVAGNYIFFAGVIPSYGNELCAYNSSTNSTVMVNDIYYTSPSSAPSDFVNMNGHLYFSASSYNYGRELWRSDGTLGGTVQVADIYTGTSSSQPGYLRVMNNILFFTAYTNSMAPDLYATDGTISGTYFLSSISGGGIYKVNCSDLTPANGIMFFVKYGNNAGFELNKTDGTQAGTTMVKDIYPGSYIDVMGTHYNSSFPDSLLYYNNTLYFSAYESTCHRELWKSNGTEAGTVMIKDINPGPFDSYPGQLIGVESNIFFTATDGVHGIELWKSDGTEAGTVMVADLSPGSGDSTLSNLTACNGTLYFINESDGSLWRSDGTGAGTFKIKNFDATKIITANNTLYIIAKATGYGNEIWKSDGTEEGTFMITNTGLGTSSGASGELIEAHGRLYFTSYRFGNGRKIWYY